MLVTEIQIADEEGHGAATEPSDKPQERRRGFTNSGMFRFWTSADEMARQTTGPGGKPSPAQAMSSLSTSSGAGRNPKAMVSSNSMVDLAPLKAGADRSGEFSKLTSRVEMLSQQIQRAKSDRVSWQAHFDTQMLSESMRIQALEQTIAQLASTLQALAPPALDPRGASIPRKSLCDLMLELDPEIF